MRKGRSAWRAVLVVALMTVGIGVPAESTGAFTVFKVTNTNDAGDGSLRRAISDAKNDPGIDAIFFKIPGPGVHTIKPLTNLPVVLDHIAGDSQPGYSGTPLIQIDGSMDSDPFRWGLVVGRGTIAALDIVNFRDGMRVFGPALIVDNVVGADPSGSVAMGNNQDGIFVYADGALIGDAGHGNVVSANGDVGIELHNAKNTVVRGNLIGTTSSGAQALGNNGWGIFVGCASHDNVIGGPGGERNVVSGNTDEGIAILGSECGHPARNIVQGNLIGVDAGGTFAIPNGKAGIFVAAVTDTHIGTWPSTGNVISGNHGPGVEVGAGSPGTLRATLDSNLIGVNQSGGEVVPNTGPGLLIINVESARVGQRVAQDHQGDPNVISGNQGGGVQVFDSSMVNLFGNLIGTAADGHSPAGNLGSGIWVSGSTDVHVGGGLDGQGSVIATNTGDGVVVEGDAAAGKASERVSIQGNWIGTDRKAQALLSNGGSGISILPNADGTRIGNVVGVEGPNVIANNSRDGITVNSSVGVRIRGNSIADNSQLGIALTVGGNRTQAAPALTNVKLANGQLTVKGTLASVPSRDFSIELFGNPACDPSGAGEGASFLVAHKVTTDSSGSATFTIKTPYGGASAPVVTGTDTNTKTGDTSGFSQCK
jgi:hypothetical protein